MHSNVIIIRGLACTSGVCPLQMGFNTWTAFGPDIDEQLVIQTAGFLNNLTLSKLGYNLIVLDGALPALFEPRGDLPTSARKPGWPEPGNCATFAVFVIR